MNTATPSIGSPSPPKAPPMPTPYDPVFDALPQPAARVDPTGRLLALNPAWRDQRPWGIAEPGLRLGEVCEQFAPLRDAAGDPDGAPQTLDAQEPAPADHQAAPRHWRLRLTRIDTETALLLATDVSAQKRIEDELRARRQETQLILDSIPALVWFKDRQGNILRVNKLAADLFGRPTAEIEGRHTREFFPEHADQYQVDDDAVFASGTSRIGIVEPIVDGHGRARWYRTDKVPLKVEGRGFDRLLALSIDVTDLVRAEERIRDSESRFRGLFDRVPAAVLEYDLSGPAALVRDLKATGVTNPDSHLSKHPEIVQRASQRVLIRGMNQALLDLFGATDNTQITEVFRRGGLGDELKIGHEMLTALWNGTSSVKFETTGFTCTGQPLDLLFRMDVPRDAEDELDASRALISLTDLTERTRRIFDQARVEQAAEERRDLGHELHDRLGQQLTGLNMLSVTLQRRLAARDLPEADDVAELGLLIKEANLEVRRLISGLTPESITAADLTTALQGLRQNVERTHGLTVTLDSEPPPAGLTDEQANHLLMIAGEAAHNAAKHGKPKHIRLALLREGRGLVLEIADDGRGLNATAPPESKPASHDPRRFSRDHPAPSPADIPMGGRGLHIMRYRARQIGAIIHFTSPSRGRYHRSLRAFPKHRPGAVAGRSARLACPP